MPPSLKKWQRTKETFQIFFEKKSSSPTLLSIEAIQSELEKIPTINFLSQKIDKFCRENTKIDIFALINNDPSLLAKLKNLADVRGVLANSGAIQDKEKLEDMNYLFYSFKESYQECKTEISNLFFTGLQDDYYDQVIARYSELASLDKSELFNIIKNSDSEKTDKITAYLERVYQSESITLKEQPDHVSQNSDVNNIRLKAMALYELLIRVKKDQDQMLINCKEINSDINFEIVLKPQEFLVLFEKKIREDDRNLELFHKEIETECKRVISILPQIEELIRPIQDELNLYEQKKSTFTYESAYKVLEGIHSQFKNPQIISKIQECLLKDVEEKFIGLDQQVDSLLGILSSYLCFYEKEKVRNNYINNREKIISYINFVKNITCITQIKEINQSEINEHQKNFFSIFRELKDYCSFLWGVQDIFSLSSEEIAVIDRLNYVDKFFSLSKDEKLQERLNYFNEIELFLFKTLKPIFFKKLLLYLNHHIKNNHSFLDLNLECNLIDERIKFINDNNSLFDELKDNFFVESFLEQNKSFVMQMINNFFVKYSYFVLPDEEVEQEDDFYKICQYELQWVDRLQSEWCAVVENIEKLIKFQDEKKVKCLGEENLQSFFKEVKVRVDHYRAKVFLQTMHLNKSHYFYTSLYSSLQEKQNFEKLLVFFQNAVPLKNEQLNCLAIKLLKNIDLQFLESKLSFKQVCPKPSKALEDITAKGVFKNSTLLLKQIITAKKIQAIFEENKPGQSRAEQFAEINTFIKNYTIEELKLTSILCQMENFSSYLPYLQLASISENKSAQLFSLMLTQNIEFNFLREQLAPHLVAKEDRSFASDSDQIDSCSVDEQSMIVMINEHSELSNGLVKHHIILKNIKEIWANNPRSREEKYSEISLLLKDYSLDELTIPFLCIDEEKKKEIIGYKNSEYEFFYNFINKFSQAYQSQYQYHYSPKFFLKSGREKNALMMELIEILKNIKQEEFSDKKIITIFREFDEKYGENIDRKRYIGLLNVLMKLLHLVRNFFVGKEVKTSTRNFFEYLNRNLVSEPPLKATNLEDSFSKCEEKISEHERSIPPRVFGR